MEKHTNHDELLKTKNICMMTRGKFNYFIWRIVRVSLLFFISLCVAEIVVFWHLKKYRKSFCFVPPAASKKGYCFGICRWKRSELGEFGLMGKQWWWWRQRWEEELIIKPLPGRLMTLFGFNYHEKKVCGDFLKIR